MGLALMYEGMDEKIAVAVLYDRIKAPTLTAKGSGELAEKIVKKAEEADVPITEDRLLAATLAQLELNEEIPESLFKSVAIVLAWVYRLQGKTPW
jgi:flagellar biosynthesis protein|tara:strand:- start:2216 stop:2500 length:285 start_codon:yes stop_codon:yes gene_type:complete